MRICAFSLSIGPALQRMGHEVLLFDQLQLPSVFDLKRELAARSFSPELIFQEEHLGRRVLLKGLEFFDCPKVFWSIDTHLNLFWHVYYFRLFDGVATPHASMLKQLAGFHTPLLRMARFGYKLPWKSHAERTHPMAFVGRFSGHRPRRTWLADFLRTQYNAAVFQDISMQEMFQTYRDTRLAPNESIMAEVNFRLLETASCGCLCFSQQVGEDQDALLAPGREFQVYEDVLELKSLLDHFLAHPELAEQKARAAWERVQKEHLVEHRAQDLLDFVASLPSPGAGLRGAQAAAAFWLTIWNLYRAQRCQITPGAIESTFKTLPQSPELRSAQMGLLFFEKRTHDALALAAQTLAANDFPRDIECNLAGSCLGILADEWSIAKQFWYRHCKRRGLEPPRPESPVRLLLLWATEVKRMGALLNAGFVFDNSRHLPQTAYECLFLAQSLEPGNLDITRQMDTLFAHKQRFDYMRLGILSLLSLHQRDNWRFALALGHLNLRSYRLHEGLEEIALAWEIAGKQNMRRSLLRTLQGLDPKGHILAAIQAMAGETQASRAKA